MRNLYLTIAGIGGLFSASPCTAQQLAISTRSSTAEEVATKAQIEKLAGQYDLSPWFYTRTIHVDSKAIPHSHPVLTLHARHLRDDELLVSTFLHEQFHWYLAAHMPQTRRALQKLKVQFPDLPLGYPRGSEDEEGNLLHLAVNFLEWQANKRLFGELRARAIMEFWAQDHYKEVYGAVLANPSAIASTLRDESLWPVERPTG